MIYSLGSTLLVLTATTVTNAYWVPDLTKRQEPTKSNNPEASKTTPPKKETSTSKKPESTVSKKEPSASKKESASKTTQLASSSATIVPTIVGSSPPVSTAVPTSISSPSSTPLKETGGSSTGAIVGGVIAGIVAIGGIAAFVILRKRKRARQMSRSNQKPDPFTMGFGSDNYNNNFPPQNSYGKENTASFDNYEVAPISTSNKQAIQQQQYQAQPPMAPVTAATTGSLGSFVVIATYIPTLSDELEIETGDRIELVVEYDDGWCQGINLSKGHTKGVFPRHCIDYATAPSHNTSNIDVERSKRVSSMYKP